ncbi:unnamed protein product [Parnassius apollo]|uniref:(apollo) hypothetical protein n=1 Tax=Parnassius apollo TaxID=110799 RepID=A0A8S3XJ52_PARAO|nr:unnamed protein product [Parnassius apollo]
MCEYKCTFKGPLTSELVHELIGDGCNSELEDSDGEDLHSRAAAAEQTSTEDEMDADIESTVRPNAEAEFFPVQNPEFSMPERNFFYEWFHITAVEEMAKAGIEEAEHAKEV